MFVTYQAKNVSGRGDTKRWRVRVAVDATNESGRNILKGVMAYANAQTSWTLCVDLTTKGRQGKDWEYDDAMIYGSSDPGLIENIAVRGRSIVSCVSQHKKLAVATVCPDDEAIGAMAARYFLDRGFNRFVFESMSDVTAAPALRLKGFRQEIEARGMEVRRIDFEDVDLWRYPTGPYAQCLKALPKPIAMFVSHDMMARGIVSLMGEIGIADRDQIAVLGVDNDEFVCEVCQPTLSSVAVDYELIGQRAAAALDRILQGRLKSKSVELIPPTGIISRETTDLIVFDEPRLSEALVYKRKHACDPCSVQNVLDAVNVSRSWLEGQFRQRFKHSPHQEIVRLRMEKSKRLLADPRLTTETISQRTGYGHPQNFIKAFRQFFGQTPAAFRKSLLAPLCPESQSTQADVSDKTSMSGEE